MQQAMTMTVRLNKEEHDDVRKARDRAQRIEESLRTPMYEGTIRAIEAKQIGGVRMRIAAFAEFIGRI